MTCRRCKAAIEEEWAEFCWFCHGRLCAACWDDHGHCGHAEADEVIRRGREAVA